VYLHRFDINNDIEPDFHELNENFTLLENKLAGIRMKYVYGEGSVTLTKEEASNTLLVFNGALSGPMSIIVPHTPSVFVVQNRTTGNYTLTLRTANGSGVIIQQANLPNHPRIKQVLCDGTDITWADDSQIVEDNLHEENPDAGYYIRWANRLQKCWKYFGNIEGITPTATSTNLPFTVYRYEIEIYYPKPFANNYPYIACNANPEHHGDMGVQALHQSPNHFIMRAHALSAVTPMLRNVSYMAVGIY